MSLPSEHERAFVAFLVSLADSERGNQRAALAALRRGLGRPPGQAVEMYPYVVPWVSALDEWRARPFYTVASLFALHPRNRVNESHDDRSTNFGASLRRAKSESGGAESRLVALLKSNEEDLPEHLRQAVALCRSNGEVPIDWVQLLHDIRGWNREGRPSQHRWAWSFWRESPPQDTQAATDAEQSAPPD